LSGVSKIPDRLSEKEKIMAFVVTNRVSGFEMALGRAARRVTSRLSALRIPTRDERADRYVSRMSVGVLAVPPRRPNGLSSGR
jgi:hypothetical protein